MSDSASDFLPLLLCSGLILTAAFTLGMLWLYSCYYYNFSGVSYYIGWFATSNEVHDTAGTKTVLSNLRCDMSRRNNTLYYKKYEENFLKS